jgi:nicotinamide mononucleotide transporter
MFLQAYFFVVTIYGWRNWKIKPARNSITKIGTKARWIMFVAATAGSILCGFFFKNIHVYLLRYFKVAAVYPFTDSFVMVLSIIATILLARKTIENWHLWILVDAICVVLYIKKEIYFLSLEYFVFFGLGSYGLYQRKKRIDN